MSAFCRLAGLAFAAVLLSASAASAADVVIVRHVPVSYRDLDLSTPAGVAVLHERISLAATEACGPDPRISTLFRDAPFFVKADYTKCRADAIGRAEVQADLR